MSWLTFLIALGGFNLFVVVFMAVDWLTKEYRRRLRLRRAPKGRMVPIGSHPRFNDNQRRAL